MKKIIEFFLNIFAKSFKVQKNKILFETGRNKIDSSPKALYKYIKNNCPNDFKTIWLVTKEMDLSDIDRKDCFYYHSLKGIYHQITAKYWIRSQSIGGIIKKKKNQVYIQLWHGCGALKKGGYQVTGEKNMPTMDHAKEWDYILAPDEKLLEHLIEAVAFKKNSFIVGKAETDDAHNITQEEIKKIKKRIGINEEDKRKIVLYAPTFREEYIEKNYCDIKINKLAKLKNIIVLINGHPLMANAMKNTNFSDKFIDVINYPDINDLYKISDVLITDYSGAIFEFSFFRKMIVLYPFDFDEYTKNRNGFTFDYKKDLPFPMAYSEEELYEIIKNIDDYSKKNQKNRNKFYDTYHKKSDGKVCERIVTMIKNGILKSEKEVEDEN